MEEGFGEGQQVRCSEAAGRVSDYVSGELGGSDRSSLEKHLEHCENCRSCADDMLAFRTRVRDLMRITAPAGLRSRIAGMVSAEKH
jgi:anti-sigma factor (TIGR02949 family)